jgi:hypothetical protein
MKAPFPRVRWNRTDIRGSRQRNSFLLIITAMFAVGKPAAAAGIEKIGRKCYTGQVQEP